MELINLAQLGDADYQGLQKEIESQRSLGDVITFLQRRDISALTPNLVVQDEFSHDLTFALPGGLYLAYATT